MNLGLRGETGVVSNVSFLAAAVSQPRALLSAAFSGLQSNHVSYQVNNFDVIGLVGPNINPMKFGSSVMGAFYPPLGVGQHAFRLYGE